jgi:hypothetical protein
MMYAEEQPGESGDGHRLAAPERALSYFGKPPFIHIVGACLMDRTASYARDLDAEHRA